MLQYQNAAWGSAPAFAQDGVLAKDMRLHGGLEDKLDAGLMLHACNSCIYQVLISTLVMGVSLLLLVVLPDLCSPGTWLLPL